MPFYRRLPIKSLMNIRDLGGFGVPGGVTKFGVFIRSEVPSMFTPADFEFLKNYGLKSVIDFRSENECAENPDILSCENWVSYYNLPIFDDMAAKGISTEKIEKFTWSEHYVRLIEYRKDWIYDVISTIEKAEGCLLYHCATGKDRTGLITMAILGLCGVAEEDIIADYSVSCIYLKSYYERMLKEGKIKSLDDPFLSTAPENMAYLINYIKSEYGDIPSYLNSCGISESSMNSIRNRFIQK